MKYKTIAKISETRTKEGYKITLFTDNESLFRKVKILLDKWVKETVSKELTMQNEIKGVE